MAGFIVWGILLIFLSSNVFLNWDLLFWIATFLCPPLILWPILQGI